jgi:hypothetical protein
MPPTLAARRSATRARREERANMDAIQWEHDWDAALARARSERKPILVDVEKQH